MYLITTIRNLIFLYTLSNTLSTRIIDHAIDDVRFY